MTLHKKTLSERDICTKFITPAIEKAGWNRQTQFLEEVSFTDGRIHIRNNVPMRSPGKRADYILYYKPNIPIAIVEAKDNKHSLGAGMQQALEYGRILDIPFIFSSNGDGFLFRDNTRHDELMEQELSLEQFPSPADLWAKYKVYRNITTLDAEKIIAQDYYIRDSSRQPRYYQQTAINRTIEAIANGQNRILLVMATGTGKTYTAFQIVYRLWKAGAKKRILFLADRTALIDQTKKGDFSFFGEKMTVVRNHIVDKSYEVYLALYQGLSGNEEISNIYKQFSPAFFDLIIVDECHRGSAKENSVWRDILTYFSAATQVGLTATPKETTDISNTEYFGEAVYTYSLRQGINDGFLAPYQVVRVGLNTDLEGYRPEANKVDINNVPVADRIYNSKDFDRSLVIKERTALVASKITKYLKGSDRYAKTIVFCVDIDHAERMRSLLVNLNSDIVQQNPNYIMRITGDNDEGKRELDNFLSPFERFPTIVTTSELLTTGVDAQTCKVIVLDTNINSMIKFKQIIGRGTRIREDENKLFFTILDFRNATHLFADSSFDGDPLRVKDVDATVDLAGLLHDVTDTTAIFDDADTDVSMEQPFWAVSPAIRMPILADDVPAAGRGKQYIDGVDVKVLNELRQHFDIHGKPITISLRDYTKNILTKEFASLDVFLAHWNAATRKTAIEEELERLGVPVHSLEEAVDKDIDFFDLICHIAFDRPPLTRRQRANNVRQRNYFAKYEGAARQVLESLLDKYAEHGVGNLENIDILKVAPLAEMGSPVEIIRQFGNKAGYQAAVKELEAEIYKLA